MEQPTRRSKLSKLDDSLDNILETVYQATERLKEQAERLEVNDYDLLSLIRGVKELSQSTGNLIEHAPFLSFRDDFEAIDRCREWVLISTEWIGDHRQIVLDCLSAYQADLIVKTGKVNESTSQYQLL